MVINVNTQFLLKNKLTPNQFLLIQLLLEDNLQVFARMLNTFPSMQEEVDTLVSIGVLRRSDRLDRYMVEPLYKNLLYGKDLFEELLSLFPSTVIRPDGSKEYLKTDLRRSRSKYRRITNEQVDIHDNILRCLLTEINTKTATNSMKYFKRLYNWLNSEGWKEYAPAESLNVDTVITDGYGTEVI